MYSEIEQQTLDIDWFFTNGEDIVFVASGGGKLPQSVVEAGGHTLLVEFFNSLPDITGGIISDSLEEFVSDSTKEYWEAFLPMVRKGLWAYDKTLLNSYQDTRYHLVARPFYALKFRELPRHIKEVIIKTQFDRPLEKQIDIKTIT